MYLSTTTFICALNLVNMSESPSITFRLLRACLFLKMLCIKCCVCLTDEYTDPFTAWYGKKSFVLYFNSILLLNHNENVCISDQNWKLIFLECGEKRTHYSVTTHIKKIVYSTVCEEETQLRFTFSYAFYYNIGGYKINLSIYL